MSKRTTKPPIEVLTYYYPGYGSARESWEVRVICDNRLLEEWHGGSAFAQGQAAEKLLRKWNDRRASKAFWDKLPRLKLASPRCDECGGPTLGGATTCVNRTFCQKAACQKMIEVRKAEYLAESQIRESERLKQEESARKTALEQVEELIRKSFHWKDGWFFHRLPDGTVRMFHRESQKHYVYPDYTIPSNEWASLVLAMTAFGERPGDWQAFMAHHNGTKDMLIGQRGGY